MRGTVKVSVEEAHNYGVYNEFPCVEGIAIARGPVFFKQKEQPCANYEEQNKAHIAGLDYQTQPAAQGKLKNGLANEAD